MQDQVPESTPEDEAFVDKFRHKLTTDDCYTPDAVYDAVADWTAQTLCAPILARR